MVLAIKTTDYDVYVIQLNDIPNVVTSVTSTHPDGIASFMHKVSSWSTPLFGPKDRTRRSEQLQREVEDANVALLRLKSRVDNLEVVS